MMRIFAWLLSILIHGGVLLAAGYLATPGNVRVDLGVPVYSVDLVNLKPKKGAIVKTVPKKAPQKKTVDVTPPAAPEAPKPAPQPKPEAKAIADKVDKPKPKAEVKEKPKAKPKPKPKPKKPEKTKEQLLAEALAKAKKKAAAEAKRRKREEDKALADIAKMVAEQDAAAAAEAAENATEAGAGGDDEDGVFLDLEAIYGLQVKEAVKANWRYPNLPVEQSLYARVFIRVEATGFITESVLIDRSGRPDFDESVLKAVQETEQLPPPPGDIREIRITFNLQDMR